MEPIEPGTTVQRRTVTVSMTTPDENLTDLINMFANMGFVAGFTAEELILNAKHVIEEQYFQSILNPPPSE